MPFSPRVLFLIWLILLVSCTGEEEPSTPLETFKTYTKAIKQKDTYTMKLLLSAETLKMHSQEAKVQNVSIDEIVRRETLFSENQTVVEFRNEKIDGERATIEVKNSFGSWETVPFVMEDGNWKIDKKGYADNLMREIEKDSQELDDIINQGKRP